MTDSLLTKYRPNNWDEVIGQDRVVDSLPVALSKHHAFLLTGPSGTGKTTLARVAATQLKCAALDLMEVDAATYTGVDDMRQVAAGLCYRPVAGAVKVVILDECHYLSKQAWTSMLKIVEHPPNWVYWFFCTTEAGKVPAAIKTRSVAYELKPVRSTELTNWLSDVAAAEKLKLPNGIVGLCAKEAEGSPRQALANLTACLTATTMEEASELLRSAIESPGVAALARALYGGAGWSELQKVLAGLKEPNAESVRQVIRAWGTKIVLSTPKEGVAGRALEVLDAFSTPFHSQDGITPVLLACARVTLQDR